MGYSSPPVSDTFRPVLRPELIQAPQPDGSLTLCDPATRCLLGLPADQVGLLELLEGELTLADVERVAGPAGRGWLRALALLGMLLGTCEPERRRLLEVAAGWPSASARLPFALLQGTRADLDLAPGAGAFPLGPLSQDEAQALRAELGPEALITAPLSDPRELELKGTFLARPAELAGEPPLAWRQFPLSVLPTAKALVVFDRGWSERFPLDSAEAADVIEDFDRWRPLLRAAARRAPLRRGPVELPGGLPLLSLCLREALPQLVQAVDAAPGGAWGALSAARAAFLALERAASEVPLGPKLGPRLQAAYEERLREAPPPGREGPPAALRLAAERLAACEPRLAAAWRSPRLGAQAEAALALQRLARQRLHGAPYEDDGALSVSFAREALAIASLEGEASRRAAEAGQAEFGLAELGAAGAALLPLLDARGPSAALRALRGELASLLPDLAPSGSVPSAPLI